MRRPNHPIRQRLSRTFFLDLLFHPRTRPIFIYALVMTGFGASVYHWLEGWSWLDSFYFVIITFTTIGYGDLTPTTPLSKIFTIFFGLNGIVMLLLFFDVIRTVRGWDIPSTDQRADAQEQERME